MSTWDEIFEAEFERTLAEDLARDDEAEREASAYDNMKTDEAIEDRHEWERANGLR